jgi:predicted DNA-binding transcriptional regulator AlpA
MEKKLKNNKKAYHKVPPIAKSFGVSKRTVYNWVNAGAPHKTKRVLKNKPFILVNTHELVEFLGIEDKKEYHDIQDTEKYQAYYL